MLIPLQDLIKKYKFFSTGVVHIGANTGQEMSDYVKAGIKDLWWIEPIPEVFAKLKKHVSIWNRPMILSNVLLSDVDGQEVDFKISSNEGQSSSMLDFGTHATAHPDVKFVNTIKLKTKRFDTLWQETSEQINYTPDFDFLNIDVQGAELKVLKGMGDILGFFRFAYIEVNQAELYKGCPLLPEIDDYLAKYNFKRVELKMTGWKWGDAFYIKNYLL